MPDLQNDFRSNIEFGHPQGLLDAAYRLEVLKLRIKDINGSFAYLIDHKFSLLARKSFHWIRVITILVSIARQMS